MNRRDLGLFLLGLGAGAVGGALWPAVRKGLRAALRRGIVAMLIASERAQTLAAEVREEVDNVLAEARYEFSQELARRVPVREAEAGDAPPAPPPPSAPEAQAQNRPPG
ncbi:hypothetical protein [Caldinitratiruptor microaerophilus]|uniref:Uncharacterized protein n=1 Tax=Caldinitratiruptor microaerophilus TaxID=671077 RepID=A0AA35GBI6_9FIRM|nr:hypothetical protein [Caldinitratiruptor microaerophilus]BDG62359.1 hypothetical protein caldi_34490 [Caldinitratiruptor microaerophilus]